MGKRGQITIFIIVAVVILALSGMMIYVWHFLMQKQEVIDPEIEPVKIYTDVCIEKIGRDGIDRMGQQAGYIDTRDIFSSFPNAYGSMGPAKIPMWFYKGQRIIPSLEYMESSLADYIIQNLDDCLENYSYFADDFVIKVLEEPKVTVIIADNDVRADMKMNIEVADRLEEKKVRISKFGAVIPIRLKKALQVGAAIVDAENEQAFLENVTIDLMAMNQDIPFTGMEIKCGKLEWSLAQIRQQIDDMLYAHLPRTRFKGTEYTPFDAPAKEYAYFKQFSMEDINSGREPDREPPEDAWDFFHMLHDIGAVPSGFRAGVQYIPGQLVVDARPKTGDKLLPKSGAGPSVMRFLCFQAYHFNYDIDYSVVVYVRDDTTEDTFTLRFALPAIIRYNAPARYSTTKSYYDAPAQYLGACQDLQDKEYDIRAHGLDDQNAGIDIPLIANFSFYCYKYECNLGKSMPDATFGNKRRLVTRLPANCYGGYIVAEKEGYLKAKKQVTTVEEQTGRINLELLGLKELELDIKKAEAWYQGASKGTIRATEELEDLESVYMVVTAPGIDDYTEYIYYDGNNSMQDSAGTKTMKFILNNTLYRIDATLIRRDSLTGGEDKILGGWRGNYTLEYADVVAADKIEFVMVEGRPTPISDEQMTNMTMYLEQDEDYKLALYPRTS